MKLRLSRILSLLLFTALLLQGIHAEEINKYDIRNIPEVLLKDAKAVIRNNSVSFEVINAREGILKVRYAVTIFNKDKQDYGVLSLVYDKFREIGDLDGMLYDAAGEEVRDLESGDIKDYSDFSSYSLLDDNRVRIAELYYDKFPYTVEYNYEMEYNGCLNWPKWYSRESADPVQHSEFTVTTAPEYHLRWWCNSDSVKPEIINEYSHTIYHWNAENLEKLPDDQEDEDRVDYSVVVMTAPSEYDIEGHEGSMQSWKEFGKWYFNLSKGRDILPQDALREIDDITKSCSGRIEKIKRLYNYMQSRTRYISIQLGIGGWQPFEASYVHSNGYGDCKALSNYMISILKAAGIKAYPVIVETGEQEIPLIEEFPCNQFNHVIVLVPGEKDTVWLECTSQDLPAGTIVYNWENRKALLVTEEGGRIINTPVSSPGKNLQKRTTEIRLNRTGSADVRVHTEWTGDQHHNALYLSKNATFEEQEKYIKKKFKVPDIKLDKFTFLDEDRNSDTISLDLSAELPRYASVTGSRIFFNPNLTDRRTNIPNPVSKKLSPIKYNYPYLDVDTVRIILPDKFNVEAVPAEVSLETSFSSFLSRTVINNDNTLSFIRHLEIKDYSIPAEDYDQYRDFFSKVVKADRAQIVLSAKR